MRHLGRLGPAADRKMPLESKIAKRTNGRESISELRGEQGLGLDRATGGLTSGLLCVEAISLGWFDSSHSIEEDGMRALTNRVTAGLGALTRVKREAVDKAETNLWQRRSTPRKSRLGLERAGHGTDALVVEGI
jgi:hypothetical protein